MNVLRKMCLSKAFKLKLKIKIITTYKNTRYQNNNLNFQQSQILFFQLKEEKTVENKILPFFLSY